MADEPDYRALFERAARRFDGLAEFMDEHGWVPALAVWGSKECYAWARGQYDYRAAEPSAWRKKRRTRTFTGGS